MKQNKKRQFEICGIMKRYRNIKRHSSRVFTGTIRILLYCSCFVFWFGISFFIDIKVEQIGASRRVRRCMDELRERVARGGDPTKLHESPVEFDEGKEPEQCGDEGIGAEETVLNMEDDLPMEGHGQDQVQEDLINEIYQMAADPQNEPSETPRAAASTLEPPEQTMDERDTDTMTKIQITEEQKARMEANRSKALERAKRARATQAAP